MQGLRALAVLMVVSYHVWFGRVSGGVDVFLLISAFLLALSFLRKAESGKPLDLARHWLHQFKRLLPAVVVVILGVLAATYVLVPKYRWLDIIEQSWASLLYVQNWVLASNSVDYYADDHSAASPLQHFWSLSVQGQVFILWPLLFLASSLLARRFQLKFRGVVLLVFGALFVASLAFSIWETYTNQAYAYFDTRARLWEFAFGTLLALALPFLRLPRSLRIVAGWVGVVAMLSGGFLLDVQGQFPGYVALWPVVAAALVIVAGQTGSPFGVDRYLSAGPLVRMGDLSYALYLWHWPVLVLALIWQDRPTPGVLGGLLVIAVSLVLAYLTMRFVERPLRRLTWADKRRRRAVIVLAVCLGLVAAPLAGWQQNLQAQAARAAAQTSADNPGAVSLLPGYRNEISEDAVTLPELSSIKGDFPRLEACDATATGIPADLADSCTQRLAEGEPSRTIVVVGNSHAQHMSAAVVSLAEKHNWTVIDLISLGCVFGPAGPDTTPECADFFERSSAYIEDLEPDAVFTIATKTQFGSTAETLVPDFENTVRRYAARGIQVIGVRDNPRFEFNMPDCIQEHEDALEPCTPAKADLVPAVSPLDALDPGTPLYRSVDMTDVICPGVTCPPIIGNVYVYIDNNHVSATYWRTMVSQFEERLVGVPALETA
ncbi:acyltransferase family protein [Arthrobacter agilis]|uniref:acyltransferase family protein n=1 Tax=Arthrobacter agilis TaxID=37921 RepID=UPI0027D76F6F|nr:acyltransferase family protein [Arthrobacter agilis]